ncbi:hypothetical protein OB920_07935 [Halobacteria archaeon HArc-gm2]|nr:hypothetical protein [Halobacteria archaeon HArc-gm2]
MGIERRLARATATLLLGCAGAAAVVSVGVVGLILVDGLTGFRLMAALAAFEVAVVAGISGYVLRKAVAGQLLALDSRADPVYRGGQ